MPLFSCLLRADRILGLIESSCEVITAEKSNLHFTSTYIQGGASIICVFHTITSSLS